MPKRIATWNRTRGIWEDPHGAMDLLSEHSEPFSATWPTSGTTRSGSAFERPTPVLRTDASASSSSPDLLPTPVTSDTQATSEADLQRNSPQMRAVALLLPTPTVYESPPQGPNDSEEWEEWKRSRTEQGWATGQGLLPTALRNAGLFPTPTTTQQGTDANAETRPGAGPNLHNAVAALLPTPTVNDMGEGKTLEWWDDWTARMQEQHANGNGHGASLAIEALRLLPTPLTTDHSGSRTQAMGNPSLEGALLGYRATEVARFGHGSERYGPPPPPASTGAASSPPSADGSA